MRPYSRLDGGLSLELVPWGYVLGGECGGWQLGVKCGTGCSFYFLIYYIRSALCAGGASRLGVWCCVVGVLGGTCVFWVGSVVELGVGCML